MDLSPDDMIEKLREDAELTLETLEKAYEAGARKGFEEDEEAQLIQLLLCAKRLRDEVRRIAPSTGR